MRRSLGFAQGKIRRIVSLGKSLPISSLGPRIPEKKKSMFSIRRASQLHTSQCTKLKLNVSYLLLHFIAFPLYKHFTYDFDVDVLFSYDLSSRSHSVAKKLRIYSTIRIHFHDPSGHVTTISTRSFPRSPGDFAERQNNQPTLLHGVNEIIQGVEIDEVSVLFL